MNQNRLLRLITEWLDTSAEPVVPGSGDFEQTRRTLMPADVILVEGFSQVDRTVRSVSGSAWTHALLYLGRPLDIADADVRNNILNYVVSAPDTQLVLETSLYYGVCVRPLSDYERFTLRICRPRSLTPADAQQVIRYAVSRLGPRRQVLHLLDLMRFLFPWILVPKPWRRTLFRYRPGRHTRTVSCSLIAEAFAFIQYPILPLVKVTSDQGTQLFRRQLPVCLPTDIEQSPYFEIIKPTWLDFASHPEEDLFPWKGSGVFTTDEAVRHLPQESSPRTDNMLGVDFSEQPRQ